MSLRGAFCATKQSPRQLKKIASPWKKHSGLATPTARHTEGAQSEAMTSIMRIAVGNRRNINVRHETLKRPLLGFSFVKVLGSIS
jgi:hypothetical protein